MADKVTLPAHNRRVFPEEHHEWEPAMWIQEEDDIDQLREAKGVGMGFLITAFIGVTVWMLVELVRAL